MIPATRGHALPAMSAQAVAQVRELESITAQCPQVAVQTRHLIHAGMYARTIRVPAGMVLTGVLIRVPTIVIVSGDCTAYVGDEFVELRGYHVLAGSAGRKQVFVTHEETDITMLFPTDARTVEEAEDEFTDEPDLLMSRHDDKRNQVYITRN
ncbi:MAG TPA: hypothetical protein VF285_03120 [Castellaniella sp.]|uniref:hypothetical protein n=1 Tax=Castellaniella sp. TaxID=1955812 RepID=UPI002F018B84